MFVGVFFSCAGWLAQAMVEPGENWIDETYERKVELGPLPGWELPLDWTTPDVTAGKKASVKTAYESCESTCYLLSAAYCTHMRAQVSRPLGGFTATLLIGSILYYCI